MIKKFTKQVSFFFNLEFMVKEFTEQERTFFNFFNLILSNVYM
jgi:hypothetical protein